MRKIIIDGKAYSVEEFKNAHGLTVGGSLDLYGTGVTALPGGLTVGEHLDLRGTGVTALPDGLTVGGSLDLRGTGVTALPGGLTVGGYLDLRGTGVTALPGGLTVGGSLYLTPYAVYIDGKMLKIGCQRHSIAEWEAFTDCEIAAMDGKTALEFCRLWKEPLLKWAKG